MFSWRSLKENGELTERFPILENRRFTQDLSGVHRLGKLTVNEGFLAVLPAKDVHFDVSILTLLVYIFFEYLYVVWLRFHYNLNSKKRIFH